MSQTPTPSRRHYLTFSCTFAPHITQTVTNNDVNRRVAVFLKEVSAATRQKDFSPGESWWMWNRDGQQNHPNAKCFLKQLGLSAEQMKSALGRYWRRTLLKQHGLELQTWPGGMDCMEWVTVVPSTGEPVPPSPQTIVTDGPDADSLRNAIVDDTSGGTGVTAPGLSQPSRPSQPPQVSAKAAAAAAEKRRADSVMRKYQKDGSMTADDMDLLLKLVKGGQVAPNDMMKKVMHTVV